MGLATIHEITKRLQDSFEKMGCPIALPQLENLSIVILRSMTGRSRVFHGYDHIFEVAGESGPHETLAALYHDVVYYQVDKGFPPVVRRILAPYIFDEAGRVRLNADVDVETDGGHGAFSICLQIFGLRTGQEVSLLQGLNEFLSAVVCSLQLEKLVPLKDLIKIVSCIEATIPFRKGNAANDNVVEVLQERVRKTSEAFGVRFTKDDLMELTRSAVTIANNDVSNFQLEDAGEFLAHTWNLLPEANVPLQFPEQHPIKDYRIAIQKMLGFFSLLEPSTVFHEYKGFPDPKEYRRMTKRATTNISVGIKYLEAVLVGTATLEALAHVTGGDLPMAMLMGDIRRYKNDTPRMEDFLPLQKIKLGEAQSAKVYQLLALGRSEDTAFDMRYSPIAAHLYPHMTETQLTAAVHNCRLMFEGQMTPNLFLEKLPQKPIVDLALACSHISLTRAQRLIDFARDLKKTKHAAA